LPMDIVVGGDRFRSVIMFVLALVVPISASYALARGQGLASFGEVLDPSRWRRSDGVGLILAALFIATVIAAIHVALGLVFDPRYKDFPVASLTGPAIALFILALTNSRTAPDPGRAELAAAAVLAGSALFIMAHEGSANWQAVWFALLLILLALTALRAGPRQAEHEETNRERRGACVVEDKPEQGEDEARSKDESVRTPDLNSRGDDRDRAEQILDEHQ